MSELLNNSAERIHSILTLIREAHAGHQDPDFKQRMQDLVRCCDPGEMAVVEEVLTAEGIEPCHFICAAGATPAGGVQNVPPGHPIDIMRSENAALRRLAQEQVALFDAHDDDPGEEIRLQLRQGANELMDVDKHYQRKEHSWFSILERHGMFAPSTHMWARDDQVREALKAYDQLLRASGPWDNVREAGRYALHLLDDMIDKEEMILIPMCQSMFTLEQWAEIDAESLQYGWCIVEPTVRWQPPVDATPGPQTAALPAGAGVNLGSGVLSPEQLIALFATLPVDITFVDHEDRVRFFSEGPNRVFVRTPVIIGRLVQHCHPPKSVDTVERILDDFRSGRQSLAEFWIDFKGRFVHIRYFALRASDGDYMGTLEVTQDCTHIRSLKGERRLLAYD